ncbi:hypothetical protein [Bailinhaonella thermotolerans]|uniref:DUF4386 family protein n=1 Tax=Bailinhaonella thermotolerans TaxID=1070861 RepID=A0A3A4B7W2_9ACTN|nr:hypothetical protein [Bailinhaonella thermotolerans]RJL34321.1 hypothetical protein D5H75_07680 [Bailinhaonella thermotolerans]
MSTFARYGLAVLTPLGPLLIAILMLITPYPAGTEGAAYTRAIAENPGPVAATMWGAYAVTWTMTAGIIAVGLVAMRGRPLLGLVGLVLAFPFGADPTPSSDAVAYGAVKAGLDAGAAHRAVAAVEGIPAVSVFGGLIFFGFLAGLIALGTALILGRTVPLWGGVALIAGTVLVPVSWLVIGSNLAVALAWLVLALGFTSASLTLLRPRP